MSRLSDVIIASVLVLAWLVAAPVIAGQPLVQDAALQQDVEYLQREWARIKYQVPDDEAKAREYGRLGERAAQLVVRWPERAEPRIWEAIILASDAGIKKGLSALRKVKKARTLLEEALAIDETALDGSAHTSLGSLYYQVPGWPLAFGDDREAERHLKAALGINPEGIDPNYFYGDYLLRQKRYEEATEALERALAARPRPGRELADAGRRQEIRAALADARERSGR